MMRLSIPFIEPGSTPLFPPATQALKKPNGLLAIGGDLAPQRLLAAYAHGIFPWFDETEPLLWWSPDPRCVFDTAGIHVSRSLRRQLRHSTWTLSVNHDFSAVIHACAAPRTNHGGTWIVPPMIAAYQRLHQLGHAHSVEVWSGTDLVGGIYGVAVGRLFCGESMFSTASGGSKIALLGLCHWLHAWRVPWLDAQISNPHLLSLGANEIPRADFLQRVGALVQHPASNTQWQARPQCAATDLLT